MPGQNWSMYSMCKEINAIRKQIGRSLFASPLCIYLFILQNTICMLHMQCKSNYEIMYLYRQACRQQCQVPGPGLSLGGRREPGAEVMNPSLLGTRDHCSPCALGGPRRLARLSSTVVCALEV